MFSKVNVFVPPKASPPTILNSGVAVSVNVGSIAAATKSFTISSTAAVIVAGSAFE